MIRDGVYTDIDAIVALGAEALAKSHYRHVPPDEQKFRQLCIMLMTNKQHRVLVGEHDDTVCGVMMGVTDQIFFSRKKSATDIFTYATRPGVGRALIREFVRWAKARADVYQIVLSVSSGMVDVNAVRPVYLSAGLSSDGGSYSWYRRVDGG